jgi:hypothetical protein
VLLLFYCRWKGWRGKGGLLPRRGRFVRSSQGRSQKGGGLVRWKIIWGKWRVRRCGWSLWTGKGRNALAPDGRRGNSHGGGGFYGLYILMIEITSGIMGPCDDGLIG